MICILAFFLSGDVVNSKSDSTDDVNKDYFEVPDIFEEDKFGPEISNKLAA